MSEIAVVLIALASIVGINVLATVLIVRAVYRRIRRSRALSSSVLRSRARLSHGSHREVLSLRVRLSESLDSGRAAAVLSAQTNGPRGEVAKLFRRIEIEAAPLEAQLRLLESERDASVLADELHATRDRVEQVVGLVRRLRSAVAAGINGISDDTLTVLRSDVDREVEALHAGRMEFHSLTDSDRVNQLQHQPWPNNHTER